MNTTIYYIVEHPTKKIHFFDWHDDAKLKEQELLENYGPVKYSEEYLNSLPTDALRELHKNIPRYSIEHKTLKHYYGTVWCAIHWGDHSARLKIEGRKKDLSAYVNDDDYTIIKKVLVPYDLFTKEGIQNSYQLKHLAEIREERRKEEEEEKERMKELKKKLDSKDLSLLEDW